MKISEIQDEADIERYAIEHDMPKFMVSNLWASYLRATEVIESEEEKWK